MSALHILELFAGKDAMRSDVARSRRRAMLQGERFGAQGWTLATMRSCSSCRFNANHSCARTIASRSQRWFAKSDASHRAVMR